MEFGEILTDIGVSYHKDLDDYTLAESENVIYHWNLVMNAKAGFYEIELFVSAPIIIPDYRLPNKN